MSELVLRKLVQGKARTLSMSLSGTSAFTTGVGAGEMWVTGRGVVDWVEQTESGLVSEKMGPDNDAYQFLALALE